jgi:hypothetical protein
MLMDKDKIQLKYKLIIIKIITYKSLNLPTFIVLIKIPF